MNNCCEPAEMPDSGDEGRDIAFVRAVLERPGNAELVSYLEKIGPCINNIPTDHFREGEIEEQLRELNKVGVIQGNFVGPRFCFCVNPKTMERIRAGRP